MVFFFPWKGCFVYLLEGKETRTTFETHFLQETLSNGPIFRRKLIICLNYNLGKVNHIFNKAKTFFGSLAAVGKWM